MMMKYHISSPAWIDRVYTQEAAWLVPQTDRQPVSVRITRMFGPGRECGRPFQTFPLSQFDHQTKFVRRAMGA